MWVKVYKGTGPTDAFLVGHWLDRCGIPTRIHGDLSAVRGEIPIGESWPTVWVPEVEENAARDALGRMNSPRLVRPAWTCPACGSDGEPDFDTCWNCDADRPPAD